MIQSSIKERLVEYLKYKGYRKSNIEDLAGVPKTLFSGNGMKQGMSEVILLRVINAFPDLNLYWLLKGEGPMVQTVKTEKRELLNRQQNQQSQEQETILPGSYSGQN